MSNQDQQDRQRQYEETLRNTAQPGRNFPGMLEAGALGIIQSIAQAPTAQYTAAQKVQEITHVLNAVPVVRQETIDGGGQ